MKRSFTGRTGLFVLMVCGILAAGISGCVGGSDEDTDVAGQDTAAPSLLKIDNAIFSIPSPFQTALLINKVESSYKKDVLNLTSNLPGYSTAFQKAVNLGVYGADLGYITVYDQPQDAISYLNSVKKLADELSVSAAFDEQTIRRFESNIGNKDSLLGLISVAYRACDDYLKNNERNDVGSLILAGGWVESLYFSTIVAKTNKNQQIIDRIGEQKHTLDNLIKLLTPYYSQDEYNELIDKLIDLAYDFDAVEIKYTYEKPTVNREQKHTQIHSKSETIIAPELLKTISGKVEVIRNQLIG